MQEEFIKLAKEIAANTRRKLEYYKESSVIRQTILKDAANELKLLREAWEHMTGNKLEAVPEFHQIIIA